MADSGGSIPPGAKGHVGSEGGEKKATTKGADLPMANLPTASRNRSTQDPLQQSEGIRIFVKTHMGKESLQVAPEDTIEKVKVQIAEKTGIPPDNQVLVLNRHLFEDDDTLLQCNVTEGATINLVSRPRKDETLDVAGNDTTCRSDDSAAGTEPSVPDRRIKVKNKNVSSVGDRGQSGPTSNMHTRKQGAFVDDMTKVYEQRDSNLTPNQKKFESNAEKLTKGKSTKNETVSDIKRDNPKAEVAGDKEDVDRFQQGEGGNRNDMPVKLEVGTKDEQDKCEGQISEEMLAKQSKKHFTDGHQQQTSHTAIGLKETGKDEYEVLQRKDLDESFVLVDIPKSEDADKSEVDSDEGMADSLVGNSNSSKGTLRSKIESLNEKKKENGKTEKEQSADSKPTTTLKLSFMKNYQGNRKETVVNAAISAAMLEESSGHGADEADKNDLRERAEDKKLPTPDSDSITKVDVFPKPVKSAEMEHDTRLDDSADDENFKLFKTNFSEDQTEEQLGEGSQQSDVDTQAESDSALTGSSSIESIAELEQEETDFDDEKQVSIGFEMKSLTQLQDNYRKGLDSDKELGPQKRPDMHTDTIAANGNEKPNTYKEENKVELERFDKEESPKSESPEDCLASSKYTLESVGQRYVLKSKNFIPVKVPQIAGKSNVSVEGNYILIDGEVEYLISDESGKIIVSKLEEAESGDVNKDNQKLSTSPETSHAHDEKEIPPGSEFKTAKKKRATTPKMEETIKMQDDGKSQTDKCHEPVVSSSYKNLPTSAEDEKKELDAVTGMMAGMKLKDSVTGEPGQQQSNNLQPLTSSKSSNTDGGRQEGKPPKPAPRNKPKENPVCFTRKLVDFDKIVEGYPLKLECCVSKPDLKVKWFKDDTPIEGSERMKLVSTDLTHSLEIDEVNLKDSGKYMVEVENIKSTSVIMIEEKPIMITLPLSERLDAQAGQQVTFECQVSKPGLEAEWTVHDQPIKDSGRFALLSTGIKHKLVVRNVDKQDEGQYVVRFGDRESSCFLHVYEKPSAPKNLAVGEVTSTSCQLLWQEPESSGDGSNIKQYHVQMCEAGQEEWMNAGTSVSTHIVISNLDRKKQYLFKVAAENEDGIGEFSEIVGPVKTKAVEKKPSAPKNLAVGEVTSTSCQLLWQEPESSGDGSNIKQYHVQMCEAGQEEWMNADTSVSTHIVISKLDRKKQYRFKVAAENEDGPGEFSEIVGPVKTKAVEKKQHNIPVRLDHGEQFQLFFVILKSPEDNAKLKFMIHSEYTSTDLKKLGVQVQNQQVRITLKSKVKDEKISETVQSYLKMTSKMIKELHVEKLKVEKGGNEVVQVLMNSDLAKAHQLYAEYYAEQNLIVYVCHTINKEKAGQECSIALQCAHNGEQGKCLKEFRYQIGFDVVCDFYNVQAMISSRFPGVRFQCRTDYDKGDCECSLEGPNEETLAKSIEFLQNDVIHEHPFNSVSFENICNANMLDKKVLEKFLSKELEFIISETKDANEVHFDLNMNAKRIVIFASARAVVNTVSKRLEKCITYTELEQDSLNDGCEKRLFDIQAKNEDRLFIFKSGDIYYCIGCTDVIKTCLKMCVKDGSDGKQKLAGNVSHNLSLKPYLVKNQDLKSVTRITKTVEFKDTNAFKLVKRRFEQGTFGVLKGVTITAVENNGKIGFTIAGNDYNTVLKTEREIKTFQTKIVEKKVSVQASDEQRTEFGSFKSNVEERCGVIIDLLKSYKVKKQDKISVSKEGIFENGMKLKISYGDAKDFWNNLLVELVQGKGKSIMKTCQGKQVTKLFVPPWNDGQAGEDDGTHSLQASAIEVLRRVKVYEYTHVCLSLDNRCNWPLRKLLKQLLKPITAYGKRIGALPVVFEFCLFDIEEFQTCCRIVGETVRLKDAISDTYEEKLPVQAKFKEGKQMPVCVVFGKLNEFKADVLVNTTSPLLDLKSGQVSHSLHKVAGDKMQKECKDKYPRGIKYGDIAVTSGYKLSCKKVFHGTLEEYKRGFEDTCIQKLGIFVLACLEKAYALSFSSIAFPAIGTGRLWYPIKKVAEVMYSSVKLFREKCNVRNRDFDVYFVIYPKDSAVIFDSIIQNRCKDVSKEETGMTVDVNILGCPADIKKAKQMLDEWSNSSLDKKSGVSASFSSDVWKSAKERNEEEIVKKALQNHRAILNEETMKMEILPLYQRHSAGFIENKCASKYDVHTQSTEKSASFCFENVSKEITINDVSPLLWDLLKSKFPDDFDNFEKKFGKITFHEPKIELAIPKNSEEAAEFVSKLEDYVQKLKDKDIHEVPIDKNIDAVAAWCKEIDAMENPFCVLNREKKMVYVFCDTYDEVMKVKYQLALKIGTVKPTGIGRRGGARLKVEESVQKDTSNMSS